MTKHVGGPETLEQVADRQSPYQPADSRQYRIVVEPDGESAGWVGYWEITWNGEQVLGDRLGRAPELPGAAGASRARRPPS